MRRVMVLWSLALVASMLGGLAVAQDGSTDEGTPAVGASVPSDDLEGDDPAGLAATGGGAPGARPALPDMDAGTYAVRLRDLESRINALKEQIFRSKARLSLLAETVLGAVTAGSQSVIVHENRMSSSYRLVKVAYALDGARIFNKADEEGTLGDQTEFEVYHGSIVPGEHSLTVNLEYRGHGYGIFSYLKGYRFRVRSSHSFTAPENERITIRVVGYEKGGPTAPLEERPAIRYAEETGPLGGRSAEAAEPAPDTGGE